MNALVFNLSSRYTFPSESTTCECGSGVSGTTKSSDNVRTLFPSFELWVTVPLLAFGPWNCDEVCEPLCANEPEAAIPNAVTTRATTIIFKMRDIFMNEPSSFFVFDVTFETRSESQTIHGCSFSHPVVSPFSSRAVVGYGALQNVSDFAAKVIALESATFLTLVNLMRTRFVDPNVSWRGRKVL